MEYGVKLALDWCLSGMNTLADMLERFDEWGKASKVRMARNELRDMVSAR